MAIDDIEKVDLGGGKKLDVRISWFPCSRATGITFDFTGTGALVRAPGLFGTSLNSPVPLHIVVVEVRGVLLHSCARFSALAG